MPEMIEKEECVIKLVTGEKLLLSQKQQLQHF